MRNDWIAGIPACPCKSPRVSKGDTECIKCETTGSQASLPAPAKARA
ncbi:MAG: hypothetical protein ACRD6X_02210 [Pyrinomonadaceae bacterium]